MAFSRWLGVFFGIVVSIAGLAQSVEFRIAIDIDDNPATGCTVTTVDGPFVGADHLLITTVDQVTMMVTEVAVSDCVGGVFNAPVVVSAGGWSVGQGLGFSGSDVIETFYPSMVYMTETGLIRVALTANDMTGGEDALIDDAGDPIYIRLFLPVPTLSQWLLVAFALLMLFGALYWMRRHPDQRAGASLLMVFMALVLVGFGAGIVLDGDPSDWSLPPVAVDATGDNGTAPDIYALFACAQGVNPGAQMLYFRIDALLNIPPTADPQMQTLLEDDPPLTLTLTGSDPEGQPLIFAIDTPPLNGTLSAITPIGPTSAMVDYTPNADYFGLDSFTFTVDDGIAMSAPATVDLTIDPVNDVPSFTAGPDQQIDKDIGPQTVPGWATAISAGPANESGQVLTFIVTGNTNPALFAATGAPAVDGVTGDLTYENEPDANGTAVIDLVLMDDGGTLNGGVDTSPPQTFSITFNAVNDCPIAQDDAVGTDEDTLLNGDVLLDNGNGPDSDIDGPFPLVVVAVNGVLGDVGVQITLPSGALLTQNMNGTFAYDPNGAFDVLAPGQMDTDTWTYNLDDSSGLCSELATVVVTIDGVNDCPVAVDDAVTTDEDTPVSGDVLVDNGLGPDSDVEGDPLTVVEVEGMPANVGVQVTLGSGALVTVNANGSFDYDPNGQFESLAVGDTATDTFTYAIDDGSGTCSELATVTVTIDGVNDCPTAVADAVMTDEDTVLNGDVTVDNGSGPDTDPETDPLNVTAVNGSGANVGVQITLGSGALLTVNSDGTFAYDPNGQFETLAVGASAMDSFTYTIDDGSGCTGLAQLTATVDITIDGVNDCPTAVDDAVATDEDTVLNGDVLAANPTTPDSDIEGDPLTVIEVEGAGANVGVQIALGSGALVTVNANGTFSYDPNGAFDFLAAGAMGMDSFTYTIDDGSGTCSEIATVNVTINGVNDCPTAIDDAVATDEDTVLNGDVLAANPTTPDSDPEGDALVVTAVNGSPANVGVQIALGAGLLTVNANGTFSFDPNGGYETLGAAASAMEMFTYTIDDGSGTCAETATVTVTINGVNDCPVAVNDAVGTLENMVLNGDVLVANPTTPDSDIEGDALVVTAVNGMAGNVGMQFALASGALLTVNANGTFSYDPNGAFVLSAGAMTTDMFTYTIDDGSGTCAETATVTVTITGVNDPPVVMDETFQTAGSRAIGNTTFEFSNASAVTTPRVFVSGDVLDNDTDLETPGLMSITAFDAVGTAGGAISLNMTTGEFTYQPPLGETAITDTFTYTVSDNDPGMPMTAMGTVTIDVFDMVWYIDGDAAVGIGSSASPFNDIPAFMAEQGMGATNDPEAGDRIFVYQAAGTYDAATAGGITLEDNQILHGEGIDLIADSVTLHAVGGNPAIANGPVITNTNGANGDVVTLALNNTVQGMTLQPQNSSGVAAGLEPLKHGYIDGKVGTALIDYVSFQPSNASDGIGLFGRTGMLTITNSNIFGLPGATGSGFRAEFEGAGGMTVNATGLTIDRLGSAIDLFNNPNSTFTFNNLNIGNTTPTTSGIDANNSGTLNVTGTSNVQAMGGAALDLNGPLAIAVTLNNLQSAMSSNHGIEVTGGVVGTLSAATTSLTNPTTRGVNIDTSFNGAGDAANFGASTINPVGTDGIRIVGSLGTFTFNNLGTITTTAGAGFIASNSGIVNFTGTAPTFNATGGPAIDIQNTAGTFSFQNLSSGNSPSSGIRLVDVGSAVNVAGTSTVNNAALPSVLVSGGSAGTLFGTVDVDNRNAVGIQITNISQPVGFAATTIDNQIANNSDSLQVTSSMAGSSVTFASLDINHNGATANGVSLTSNVGTVTINGAGSDIGGTAGTAFLVGGGQGDVTYDGTINNTASRSVDVQNRMAGTVAFNGAISDTGSGILLNNNTGSTINFTANLDLDTGANNAFTATGGGTISATGTTSQIGSAGTPISGIGVNIANTTIGGAGVTFREIHVNGAASGILLDTTGSMGVFTVTGDGTLARNGSGGTIASATNHAVVLNNANGVTLQSMRITGVSANGRHGISSSGGSNFTFSGLEVNSVTGGLAVVRSSAWRGTDLGGVNRVDNDSLFTGFGPNADGAIDLRNPTANMTSLTIDNSRFEIQNENNGKSVVFIQSEGGVNMGTVTVQNSDFVGHRGISIQTGSIGSSTLTTVIDGNEVRDANPAGLGGISGIACSASGSSNHTITISNNDLDDVQLAGGNAGSLTVSAFNTCTLDATINLNRFIDLDTDGDVVANAQAIRVVSEQTGGGAVNVDVTNNTLNDIGRQAIFVSTRNQAPDVDVTISGNIIGNLVPVGFTNRDAIAVSAEDDSNLDVLISMNNVTSNTTSQEVLNVFTDRVSGGNTPILNATITSNTFTNSNGGGADNVVIETLDVGETICANVDNNTINGVTTLDMDNSSGGTFDVPQANTAAISAANGGVTVVAAGLTFNQPACQMPN